MSHEIIAIINRHKFGGPATFAENIIKISKKEALKFVFLKNLKTFFKCNYCLVINLTKKIHILILCKMFNKKVIYRLGAPFFFLEYADITTLRNLKRRIINFIIIFGAIMFSNKIIFQTKYCLNAWILEFPFLKRLLEKKNISFILNGAFKINNNFKKTNFKNFYFFSFEWSIGIMELIYLNEISKQLKIISFVYGNVDGKIEIKKFKNLRFKKIKKKEYILKEVQKLNKFPILIASDLNPACSNAITEAVMSNIPVIAPSLGGNKEILGDKYKLIINVPQKILSASFFKNWIGGKQLQTELKKIFYSLSEKKIFNEIIQQNNLLQKKIHIKTMYKNYVNFIKK